MDIGTVLRCAGCNDCASNGRNSCDATATLILASNRYRNTQQQNANSWHARYDSASFRLLLVHHTASTSNVKLAGYSAKWSRARWYSRLGFANVISNSLVIAQESNSAAFSRNFSTSVLKYLDFYQKINWLHFHPR